MSASITISSGDEVPRQYSSINQLDEFIRTCLAASKQSDVEASVRRRHPAPSQRASISPLVAAPIAEPSSPFEPVTPPTLGG